MIGTMKRKRSMFISRNYFKIGQEMYKCNFYIIPYRDISSFISLYSRHSSIRGLLHWKSCCGLVKFVILLVRIQLYSVFLISFERVFLSHMYDLAQKFCFVFCSKLLTFYVSRLKSSKQTFRAKIKKAVSYLTYIENASMY